MSQFPIGAESISARHLFPFPAVARINVLRAEEMLKLYADIETQEPQLNPDSLKSEK
ncbi:MAG: hypothetical protein WKF77_05245 [Planctomycetaceae bacterium]